MRQSANLRSATVQGSALVVGGCYGTCFLRDSDDEEGRTGRRQFLLGNCLVMTVCMAIVVVGGGAAAGQPTLLLGSVDQAGA